MLKVLSSILCDLDPKVKVIGQKAGICDGVPSTSALVLFTVVSRHFDDKLHASRKSTQPLCLRCLLSHEVPSS